MAGRKPQLKKIAAQITAVLEGKTLNGQYVVLNTPTLRSLAGIKSNNTWAKILKAGLLNDHRVQVDGRWMWKYNGAKEGQIITPGAARSKQSETPLEHALKERLVQVERELSEFKTRSGRQQLFNEEIKSLVTTIPPYFTEYIPQHKTKVTTPVTSVLQLCDWQIGQIIDKHMTNFFGEYDYNLAVDRAFMLVNDFTKWLDVQRAGYVIKNGVVIINGDMVNGDLRKSSTITNEWPTPAQQVRCAALLAEVLRRLAAHYEHLTVEYVVPDNHARNTKRFEPTAAGLNSNNLPVAELTRLHLKEIPNIEFKIHLEMQARVLVNGIPYLVEHGHGIRSNLGYPWYAMGHKIGREAKKRMNTPRVFTKMVIGHFHTPMFTPDFIVGGSLCGTSENDSAHGRHYPPSQTAWLVHPRNREFNWLDFILADFETEEETWYDWVNDLPEQFVGKLDPKVKAKRNR